MACHVVEAPQTKVEENPNLGQAADPPELAIVPQEKEEKAPEKEKRVAAPMRKMFSLATWPEMFLLFAGILGAIGNGAIQPCLIFIFGRLMDAVGTTTVDIKSQLDYMAYVGVGAIGLTTMQACCLRIFAQRITMRMRRIYFESVLHKDIAWFDATTPAALPGELNSDAEKVAEAFGDKLGLGIAGIAGFVISMFIGFFLGWQLALVVLAAVPLMSLGMVFFGKAVQEVAQESQSWYSQAAVVVEESLFALRTVVAFGGEQRELERYSVAVKTAQAGALKNSLKLAIGMGWTESVFALSMSGALYYGMTLVYTGVDNQSKGKPWTGGDIIIVFFIMLVGGFQLGQLEPALKFFDEGRVAMARFLNVVEAKSTIEVLGQDSRATVSTFDSFEFRDVVFAYPARPEMTVLKHISFRITMGQKVAFVGESGSGKSTVMSLLERFYDPCGGAVLVNNMDLRTIAPASLRSLIGYVGQEPVLFATSIRNNIKQGWPQATEEDLQEALKGAQCTFIDNLPEGLETFAGSGGSHFSGGQKQRLAIARAVLRKPKVLFLDEATSALDGESEAMIQETLDSISSTGIGGAPLTTVAIAHRLRTIRNSDVIYVLGGGVIVEQGSHEELIGSSGGVYAALAAAQQSRVTKDVKKAETIERQVSDEEKVEAKVNEDAKASKVSLLRLLQYNRPEWPYFVPGILGAICRGACMPIQGYLLVAVLDSLFLPFAYRDKMKDEVAWTVIYWVIMACCLLCATTSEIYSFSILNESMTARLRVSVLRHIFRLEVGYHDDPAHTPAQLGTALQLWAYRVKTLNSILQAVAEVVSSISTGLAIAFYGSWEMTLVMLAAIPVLAAANAIQFVFITGGTNLTNEDMKLAQQVVSDAVQNARTVHATGLEAALVEDYDVRVHLANKGYMYKSLISGAAFGFGLSASPFVMCFGFWYADRLMNDGTLNFKQVMIAFLGVVYAALGAGQAAGQLGDTKKAKQAYQSMFELLDRKTTINGMEPEGKVPEWDARDKTDSGNITFENVRFAYPFRADVKVLRGTSFTIKSGMSVGLVGPSGGGKSTIMALLQRFYDPVQGNVLVGSARLPLNSVNIRWWRRQIGFVGQEPILFDTTVRENVLYGLDADNGETIDDERLEVCKRKAHLDFLDKLQNGKGWESMVGPRGSRLSGGQKQRVAICRALVRDPPILLLDEATSALDSESEKVVQRALEEAREGRTSIAIAHRLSTVQNCDMILVAGDGRIIEEGTHDQLMALDGVYKKLSAASTS